MGKVLKDSVLILSQAYAIFLAKFLQMQRNVLEEQPWYKNLRAFLTILGGGTGLLGIILDE